MNLTFAYHVHLLLFLKKNIFDGASYKRKVEGVENKVVKGLAVKRLGRLAEISNPLTSDKTGKYLPMKRP
jgi:hypothetical protein